MVTIWVYSCLILVRNEELEDFVDARDGPIEDPKPAAQEEEVEEEDDEVLEEQPHVAINGDETDGGPDSDRKQQSSC